MTEQDSKPQDQNEQAAEQVEAQETAAPVTEPEKPTPSRTAPPLPEGKHYVWGMGRRRTSVARIRIRPGSGKFVVNKRDMADYFHVEQDRQTAVQPLELLGMVTSWDIWANVNGGGHNGQAGAVMLGLARALVEILPEEEHTLRERGMLTRDARMKERKKPGQPGARKRFQYSKR